MTLLGPRLALFFGLAAVCACTSPPAPTPAPTPARTPSATAPTQTPPETSHLSVQGIELDYPAGWGVNATGWQTTGFGTPLAIIGTLPWGPCDVGDINCHYSQQLRAGQISVEVGTELLIVNDLCARGRTRSDLAERGPSDPPATGSLARIDGRPAIRTDYVVNRTDYYNSDEWRDWLIAAPGTTDRAFTINAMYQGPDLATLRAQLDQLVASIRLQPSTAGSPDAATDCGPPFPS